MPSLPLALSSYRREEGDLPPSTLINMYTESAPTEEKGVTRQSRPGLDDREADMGTGPVEQLFLRDLVLTNQLYGVSGGYLYEGTTQIGAIDGTGFCSMAGNEIGLMTTQESSLYFYDGATLGAVAFPDGADVAHVSVGGSRYWMVRKDTGKLYFTDALESDVEALDFLTAESLPDRLLQTLWIDGALIGFGAESIEFFRQTGNNDLPLAAIQNLVIEKGIRATGCACSYMETFAAVTNENQVILQNENNIISEPGLEQRIENSAECSLFTFMIGGIEFLALRIDSETQVYNRRSGAWSEFASYGQSNWIPQCFEAGIFGSAVDGKTLAWGAGYSDLGGVLERRIGGGFPIDENGVTINNLRLRANTGQTPYLSGQYADPQVEMRTSDDAGQTWSDWEGASLGAQGNYREQPEWRALGSFSYPGAMFEFRVTDPVPFRVSDASINGQWGGR